MPTRRILSIWARFCALISPHVERPLESNWVMTAVMLLSLLQLQAIPSVNAYFQESLLATLRMKPFSAVELRVMSPLGSELGASQELMTALTDSGLFTSVAAYGKQVLDTDAGRAMVANHTPDLAQTLGFRAEIGHLPQPAPLVNGVSQPSREVLVSQRFYRDRLKQDEHVVGRWLVIEGRVFRVAGVLPADQDYRLDRTDVYLSQPLATLQAQWLDPHYQVAARPKSGVTAKQMAAGLHKISVAAWGTWPKSNHAKRAIETAPLSDSLRTGVLMKLLLLALPFLGILIPTASTWADQARRWKGQFSPERYFGFLTLKVLTLYSMLVVLWMLWGGTYPMPVGEPILDLCIETSVALTLAVLALGGAQWIKHDQRVRCPVCLYRLRMPIHAGSLGSVLLDRPTEEFICLNGHGYLSLQKEQLLDEGETRWRKLDNIWDELSLK